MLLGAFDGITVMHRPQNYIFYNFLKWEIIIFIIFSESIFIFSLNNIIMSSE